MSQTYHNETDYGYILYHSEMLTSFPFKVDVAEVPKKLHMEITDL